MSKIILKSGFLILLFMSNVQAKMVNKKLTVDSWDPKLHSLPVINEDLISANIKLSENHRKPNSANLIDESMMSNELKEAIKKLHSAKSSEELDEMLVVLHDNYAKSPNDLKFYITQVYPLRAFRGIVYRLKPLFENNSRILHSRLLTFAKKIATTASVLYPFDYVNAGVEFLTSPYYVNNKTMVRTIDSEVGFQNFLARELYPLINESLAKLEDLKLVEPVVWDNQIIYGKDSFQDGVRRFKLIGEVEKNVLIASLYTSLASIDVVLAYNLDHSLNLYKDIGYLYGLDGFGVFGKIEGVSTEKIAHEIRKPEYAKVGTLNPHGGEWMKIALKNSQRGVNRLKKAWDLSAEERKMGDNFIINTGYLNVSREAMEDNIHMIDRVVNSSSTESLRSGVTGDIIQINYSEFFINPPADLKAFLPLTFEQGSNVRRTVKFGFAKGKNITYRNYTEGRGLSYSIKKISPYFPSVKTNKDVFKTVRVLSAMRGNWLKIQ